MADTKTVRINGAAFLVPADELTDPQPGRPEPWCRTVEPEGEGICTLAPHEPEVMHIAHDGDGDVIAMWGKEVRPGDGHSL